MSQPPLPSRHKTKHQSSPKLTQESDTSIPRKRKRRETVDLEHDNESDTQSPPKIPKLKKSRKTRPPSESSHTEDNLTNDSPFHVQRSSLYLPLSPISQFTPLEGLCAEHLSPLILTYYPPFGGVVISYGNVILSEEPSPSATQNPGRRLAKNIDEYASSFVWVTADFLLLKPKINGYVEGWVNIQSESHLGLLCWNLFNASIERARLPADWKWIPAVRSKRSNIKSHNNVRSQQDNSEKGGEGYYENRRGERIAELVRFRVKDLETASDRDGKGFLSIKGSLLDRSAERELIELEKSSSSFDRDRGQR
ncbi:MAG: hypothetical protein M1829_006389 [Trizodia sp. TS-e1964]|nr:MAG: hypothetical protein M1829_006389 [Trizodia sp. TS-e1964]